MKGRGVRRTHIAIKCACSLPLHIQYQPRLLQRHQPPSKRIQGHATLPAGTIQYSPPPHIPQQSPRQPTKPPAQTTCTILVLTPQSLPNRLRPSVTSFVIMNRRKRNLQHYITVVFILSVLLVFLHFADLPRAIARLRNVTASNVRVIQGDRGVNCSDGAHVLFDSNGVICERLDQVVSEQLIHVVEQKRFAYMFCVPPKNGCTYHLALMLRIMDGRMYKGPQLVHVPSYTSPHELQQQTDDKIEQLLRNLSIPRYRIVRNPMMRLLSAYLNKVEARRPKEQRSLDWFYKFVNYYYPIHATDDRNWSRVNVHIRPQMKMCGLEKRGLANDFVTFHVEKPEEYVDFIYDVVPLQYLQDGWGEHFNVSFREASLRKKKSRSVDTDERFFTYYNSTVIFDQVARGLAMDVRRLGYEEDVARMREEVLANENRRRQNTTEISSSSSEVATSNNDLSDVHINDQSANNGTCDDNMLFDSNGAACMNLTAFMKEKRIYVVEKPTFRYLFCVPPKNGCTYHKALMLRVMHDEIYRGPHWVHSTSLSRKRKMEMQTTEKIEELLKDVSMPRYRVVRNPLMRALSGYLNKVEPNRPKSERGTEGFYKYAKLYFPVGSGVDRNWSRIDVHFRAQMKMCLLEKQGPEAQFKTFHVEKPEEYVDFIYSIVPSEYLDTGWGEEFNVSFREASLREKKERTVGTDEKFFKYYNSTVIFDHMARELAIDVKGLGYEKDVAWMRKEVAANEKRTREEAVRKEREASSTTNTAVDKTASDTDCDEDFLFDKNGNPCEDITDVISDQLIHLVNSPDTQYLFCVPPKNGLTYHLALMLRIMEDRQYTGSRSMPSQQLTRKYELEEQTAEKIKDVLTNETMPRYLIVRNPMERTLSAYLDKIESTLPSEQRSIDSFYNFINEIFPRGVDAAERDWEELDMRWRPQTTMCGLEKRELREDFDTFRFEMPEEIVKYLYDVVPEEYLDDGWGEDGTWSFRTVALVEMKLRLALTEERFYTYFNSTVIFDHVAGVLETDIVELGYKDEVAHMREIVVENEKRVQEGAAR